MLTGVGPGVQGTGGEPQLAWDGLGQGWGGFPCGTSSFGGLTGANLHPPTMLSAAEGRRVVKAALLV